MIRIIKNNEPPSWTEIRKTPNITYDSADKKDLRRHLLDEQGCICGYCMRRIGLRDSKIEHINPQSADPSVKNTLNYKNLIICCNGDILGNNNPEEFHCDTKKAESKISFSPMFIDTLFYSSKDGNIQSTNPQFDIEINEILNLNLPILKQNRLNVLRTVIEQLAKKKDWKKAEILAILKKWSSKNSDGKFYSYCGIVIWFLTKHLNNR